MANETVRLARAAWQRLKKDRGSWTDWIIVGGALLEGRWAATREVPPAIAKEASGLTSAYLVWHLDRGLRSLAHVER